MCAGGRGIQGSRAIYEKSRTGISFENPKNNPFTDRPIQATAPGAGFGSMRSR